MASHDIGMVGLVKRLVDHVAARTTLTALAGEHVDGAARRRVDGGLRRRSSSCASPSRAALQETTRRVAGDAVELEVAADHEALARGRGQASRARRAARPRGQSGESRSSSTSTQPSSTTKKPAGRDEAMEALERGARGLVDVRRVLDDQAVEPSGDELRRRGRAASGRSTLASSMHDALVARDRPAST
jgi:hypothetical protein